MTIICLASCFYAFSSCSVPSLEKLCKATVYLSLALGNVVMALVSVRTAVQVVRQYQAIRKGRRGWNGVVDSTPSAVKSLELIR